MLKNLLNLLPVSIVRKIGDSSFANLQKRGEINIWMVGCKKTSSLVFNRNELTEEEEEEEEEDNSIPKAFFYLGLRFSIFRCYLLQSKSTSSWCCDWFVYDGIELIAKGKSNSEENAIASAKKWIESFLGDDLEA
ncbi:hypothetical protein C7B67_16460 [filamentous cyanobacterium Phorm 6]|nr:hypothetical protein C7B67_16460 [filamentous cyanobacterium Phorm 6]